MITEAEIEEELTVPCGTCHFGVTPNFGGFNGDLARIWCMFCGGSGRKSTWRHSLYPEVVVEVEAPYKREGP